MSTLKSQFDEAQARELLTGLYPDAHSVARLAGGEASQAFAFVSGSQPLVLRVNHHASYHTDAWISERLGHSDVPVPRVLHTGQTDGHFWAISERAPGRLVEGLPMPQLLGLRDDLAATMIGIHDIPIDDTTGYGPLTGTGTGSCPTWRDYLTTDGTYGTFVDWERALAQSTTRQRSLVETAWAEAHRLFDFCPEDHVLDHGDYTYDNILTDGHRVTGVVDWSNCLIGDPLWDVAWTDIWTPGLGFAGTYLQARPTIHAPERLLCYQLLIAASAIGFYIHTDQPAVTPWIEEQLELRVQLAQSRR